MVGKLVGAGELLFSTPYDEDSARGPIGKSDQRESRAYSLRRERSPSTASARVCVCYAGRFAQCQLLSSMPTVGKGRQGRTVEQCSKVPVSIRLNHGSSPTIGPPVLVCSHHF